MVSIPLPSAFYGPVLRLLFPETCRVCGVLVLPPFAVDRLTAAERCCCPDCRAAIAGLRLTADEAATVAADVPPGLSSRHAVYRYEGIMATLMQRWKYDRRRELFSVVRDVLLVPAGDRLAAAAGGADGVVPVPLGVRSWRRRGFNQALFIAAVCADLLGVPLLARGLVKIRSTPRQATLDRRARQGNLAGAFCWRGGVLAGRRLLLCDDVTTTGATLAAAAAPLIAAGARVGGFTLCHTPPPAGGKAGL
ncbi:MAG: ComF family protein [Deltaproteobacteria bacterium]|nr:ComF family protein [Candidatus Anaeroferrophillacea bacterium]